MLQLANSVAARVRFDTLRRVSAFHAAGAYLYDRRLAARVSIPSVPPDLQHEINSHDLWLSEGARTIQVGADLAPAPNWLRSTSAEGFVQDRPLSFDDLSFLVRHSFFRCSSHNVSRPYPSAGALFPVHVFLVVSLATDCGSVQPGVYHVLPRREELEIVLPLTSERANAPLRNCALPDQLMPPLYIVYAINLDLAVFKYGYRGYRFALMEVGSCYHQTDLVCRDRGLASRLLGAFPTTKWPGTAGG